jgi:hypothetical protein
MPIQQFPKREINREYYHLRTLSEKGSCRKIESVLVGTAS